ncbi:prolyl oligopeptidase family protein [Streptomyces sp. NPDC101150]|uniref:prolyl oligopeptidase family serine peptidase n=1 Tax=Streptomyces sp. NPDC101150 TaxID=3366114 RepID=UPI0037F63F60
MALHMPDDDGEDPYLWLEDMSGNRTLDWVHARNQDSTMMFATGLGFDRLREGLRAVLDSDARVPAVERLGLYLYNFWQDAEHPRGQWRRTTLAEYRTDTPAWDLIIDLDAQGREEGENWVWRGACVLGPDYRRALVSLSRGGADAVVVREFDIEARRFVEDGFTLAEAKNRVAWIDIDSVYVSSDFGEGSLTSSGYPRLVKEWRRNTPLEQANTLFEGGTHDVLVGAYRDPTPGFERDFVYRLIDFYRSNLYLREKNGDLVRVDIPEDAEPSVHRNWLLVKLRSPWHVANRTYPAGALLAADFEAFMEGQRNLTVVFEPTSQTALKDHKWTRDHLLLTVLDNVKSELRALTPSPGAWNSICLQGAAAISTVSVIDTNPHEDNEFLTLTSGFTTPPALGRGVVGHSVEVLKQGPVFFDSNGVTTDQHFATSRDGTKVPYFVINPSGNRTQRTLLTGYGGFEVSLMPQYNAMIGRGWLERGGTYVVANVRGGGEYGPEWHAQATKSQRYKVHEDFAAVAADLSQRGITSPQRLAVQGGSNGGLLMGVMLTRYPELFGAIAAQAPILDMRRYRYLLAGASWTAEYGDPDNPAEWAYISKYSPYHNLREEQRYPPVLFATSSRDDRVHPGHARKMAARMHEHGHVAHYYENVEGGHGGASNNEQAAFQWALILDFLWTQLSR